MPSSWCGLLMEVRMALSACAAHWRESLWLQHGWTLYLKQHVLGVHNPEKSFRCEICDYATAFKNNLEKHMQKHSSEKPYKCELCDFESKHKEYIKKHVSLCHNEEECEVCGFKTRLKNDLITHLEQEHNVCRTCECCESGFQPEVLSEQNFKTNEQNFKASEPNVKASEPNFKTGEQNFKA